MTRVLIVENKYIIGMDLETRLKAEGMTVCGRVSTGRDAVEAVRQSRPDLVVIDILLPDSMDGIETARGIRAASDVPLVFLTELSDVGLLKQAEDIEPFAYVLKPFENRELKAALDRAEYKGRLDRDRRNARLAVKRERDRFEFLAEELPLGLALIAPDGRIEYLNLCFTEITGYTVSDTPTIGGWAKKACPDENQRRLFHPDEFRGPGVGGSRRSGPLTFKTACRDGTIKDICFRKAVYENGGGLIICVDVTGLEQTQRALRESEERFRLFMKHLSAYAYMKDQDGRYVYANDAFRRFSQMKPEAIIGRTDADFFHPAVAEKIQMADRSVMYNGGTTELMEEIPFRPGRSKFWTSRFKIEREGASPLLGGISLDITRRLETEEALRQSEAKHRALLDNSPDIILRFDRDFRIVYANPAASAIFSEEPAWLIGRTCLELGLDNRRAGFLTSCVARVFDTGRSYETRFDLADGHRHIHFDWRLIPEKADGDIPFVMTSARDITELVMAQEAVRNSERKYRSILDSALGGIGVYRQDACLFGNRRIGHETGYSRDEFMKKRIHDVIHPDDLPEVRDILDGISLGQDGAIFEGRAITRTGETKWVRFAVNRVDWDGDPATVVFSHDINKLKKTEAELQKARDEQEQRVKERTAELLAVNAALKAEISEREEAEKALKKSEELFRTIFNGVNDVITVHDIHSVDIVDLNEKVADLIGYSREEILNGRSDFVMWTEPPYTPEAAAEIAGRVASDGPQTFLWKLRHKNGSSVWCEVVARRAMIGGVERLLAVTRDITKRMQVEEEILSYQAKLRRMSSELLLTEERERRRMAVGLHDEIGQSLAVVKMQIQSLTRSAGEDGIRKHLDDIREVVEEVIGQTRSLTMELSPPVLYELGLGEALAWLCEQIEEKHHLTVDYNGEDQPWPLDENLRVFLFRAVRELLINTVKHASATRVAVTAEKPGEKIRIRVRDDGRGFDQTGTAASRIRSDAFGLFSIRERIQTLGGRFDVRSSPGKGTDVTLQVPLKT